MAKADIDGPLRGVRVIELAHILAGPVCGLMLADMGAEVIKVERIPDGDTSRRMEPPKINGESAAFMIMNRGKRGIAVDLKTEDGKEVMRRLLADADVVVENYRAGTMDALGLGYDTLKLANPRLVYCAISGFGRTGPLADMGGFDLVAQGMSGLMSITGEGPGRPPIKVGSPIADITAGLLAALGIVAALNSARQTGRGQVVDTSLFEAGIIHTYWQSAICMATGRSPGPMGSAHPLNSPYQAFPTSDGWITVGAPTQPNWLRLVDALGAPHLAEDPRYRENAGRMSHLAELDADLSVYFRRRATAEWLAILDAAAIPAGPVLSIAEMHAHPQTLARNMVFELDHPVAGRTGAIGLPIKFSETPGGAATPAPTFGQHTGELLAELGFSESEVSRMLAAGSVA